MEDSMPSCLSCIYELENSPGSYVTLDLFVEVTNSYEVRQAAIEGRINAALLKPAMVVNPFQVVLAAHKAIHLNNIQKLKTRTLHSEIIFNLSPTNNITDSFKKFGLADNDRSVLVAIIGNGDANDKVKTLSDLIKGKQVPMDSLVSLTDEDGIKKVYKVEESELAFGSLGDAVVFRMATKDSL